jgi:hypothetical protein
LGNNKVVARPALEGLHLVRNQLGMHLEAVELVGLGSNKVVAHPALVVEANHLPPLVVRPSVGEEEEV